MESRAIRPGTSDTGTRSGRPPKGSFRLTANRSSPADRRSIVRVRPTARRPASAHTAGRVVERPRSSREGPDRTLGSSEKPAPTGSSDHGAGPRSGRRAEAGGAATPRGAARYAVKLVTLGAPRTARPVRPRAAPLRTGRPSGEPTSPAKRHTPRSAPTRPSTREELSRVRPGAGGHTQVQPPPVDTHMRPIALPRRKRHLRRRRQTSTSLCDIVAFLQEATDLRSWPPVS